MSNNKGLRLHFCKECGRKRFHSIARIPDNNFKWTCSKGHSWVEIGITLHRVEAIIKDTFTEDKLKNLFERDDIFYQKIKL